MVNDTEILVSEVLEARGGRVKGWVGQPDFRGSWDIIWTSLVTIFICTFTLQCLNAPAKQDTLFILFRRRVLWMALAIIAPEIVVTYAAGQWSRARHSLKEFHNAGYQQWTMRMAFFADMGGFVLETTDGMSFPLNAKQLHWLVINNHIPYPQTDVDEIWDKSKQDRFSRLVTAFQVGYTILHAVGRVAQQLAITTLELNTLGIIFCSLMTSFAWLHKPADVRMPIRIISHSQATIEDIVGDRPWRITPLDFIDENGPGWALNVQPFVKIPEYLLCLATLMFTAIHVADWNLLFPTATEKVLWRVSSFILFAASWTRLGRWKWLYLWVTNRSAIQDFEEARDKRLQSEEKRELATLPLAWEFWTIAIVAFLYGVARAFMIMEVFLELRDMDATAYVNVNWSQYIPHI
ncbi:hypothetical protein QBC38DRAFT_538213 [Podospora fimiseda]|uniref:Uncharacterized protein n=1 Tax=Podospora fimiseda TaxID=252190 RepID=A0AAN7GUS7_9PEZI|nr:hypothetical protein QBC38DRAFT_538213 [Podospora fimiseda]